MKLTDFSITAALFAVLAAADDVVKDVYACQFYNAPTSNGFDVKFFQYEAGNTADYADPAYMAYGYSSGKVVATAAGIVEPYTNLFAVTNEDNDPVNGQIYGDDITISNFTAEFKGYFKADQTGYYTFNMNSIDDAAMLFIGSSSAFKCCDSSDISEASGGSGYQSYAYLPFHSYYFPNTSYTTFLEEGYYYPIRIVYTNIEGSILLEPSFTNAAGVTNYDFTNYIYSASQQDYAGECIAETTLSNTVAHHTTTTTSYWAVDSTSVTTKTDTVAYGTDTVLDVLPHYTTVTVIHQGTDLTTSYSYNIDGMTVSIDEYLPKSTQTIYSAYIEGDTVTFPISDAGDYFVEVIGLPLTTSVGYDFQSTTDFYTDYNIDPIDDQYTVYEIRPWDFQYTTTFFYDGDDQSYTQYTETLWQVDESDYLIEFYVDGDETTIFATDYEHGTYQYTSYGPVSTNYDDEDQGTVWVFQTLYEPWDYYVTVVTIMDIPEPTTSYYHDDNNFDDGTVYIEIPKEGLETITITTQYFGTIPSTTYELIGTVVFETDFVPHCTVTSTVTSVGNSQTKQLPYSGGCVTIEEIVGVEMSTVYTGYTGTTTSTHTGEFTVEVFTPRGVVTSTSTWESNFFSLTTVIPTDGPVTILYEFPSLSYTAGNFDLTDEPRTSSTTSTTSSDNSTSTISTASTDNSTTSTTSTSTADNTTTISTTSVTSDNSTATSIITSTTSLPNNNTSTSTFSNITSTITSTSTSLPNGETTSYITVYTTLSGLDHITTITEGSTVLVEYPASGYQNFTAPSNSSSTETPGTTIVVTETLSGIVTSYTTFCPLSDFTKSYTESVVTQTSNGIVTEYTTYCPLSGATSTLSPTISILYHSSTYSSVESSSGSSVYGSSSEGWSGSLSTPSSSRSSPESSSSLSGLESSQPSLEISSGSESSNFAEESAPSVSVNYENRASSKPLSILTAVFGFVLFFIVH